MAENYSNPIGKLNEIGQNQGITPEYTVIDATGLSHDPTFTIQARFDNIKAIGQGSSKKLAKTNAARNILKQLKDNQQRRSGDQSQPSQAAQTHTTTSAAAKSSTNNLSITIKIEKDV